MLESTDKFRQIYITQLYSQRWNLFFTQSVLSYLKKIQMKRNIFGFVFKYADQKQKDTISSKNAKPSFPISESFSGLLNILLCLHHIHLHLQNLSSNWTLHQTAV